LLNVFPFLSYVYAVVFDNTPFIVLFIPVSLFELLYLPTVTSAYAPSGRFVIPSVTSYLYIIFPIFGTVFDVTKFNLK